jgi:hypothetical protein
MGSLETVRGLIALEERATSRAIEHLQQGLTITDRFAVSNAIAASMSDRLHAYLALAYAQSGDMEEARRHYRIAEPRLRCFKLQDTRERCEAALGRHAE